MVRDAPLRVQRLRHARRLLLSGAALHRVFQVEPGAERGARAFQHHDAGVAVALQALEVGVQRVDQAGIKRVETVRAIQRHPVDAVMVFDQQRLSHAVLLHQRSAVLIAAPSPLVGAETSEARS